jgi:hypothetical protein
MQVQAKNLQPGQIIKFQADQLCETTLRCNTPLEATILRVCDYLTYQVQIQTIAGFMKPVDKNHIFTVVTADSCQIKGQIRHGQYGNRKTFKGVGIE